jgi:hypothetical protein
LYDSNKVRRWWDFGYQYKILEGIIDKNGNVNRLDLIRLRVRLAVIYGHTRGLVRSIPTMLGRENDYVLNILYDRYVPIYLLSRTSDSYGALIQLRPRRLPVHNPLLPRFSSR